MSDVLHLVVYTFDDLGHASEARRALESMERRLGGGRPGPIALVQKSSDGRIRLHEGADLREELSALAGSVAGGLTWFVYTFAGMLGPQPALMAEYMAEDAVHRLVRDSGFSDAALFEIGEALDAGSVALIALVPAADHGPLVAELERFGGRIWQHELPSAIAAELRSGG